MKTRLIFRQALLFILTLSGTLSFSQLDNINLAILVPGRESQDHAEFLALRDFLASAGMEHVKTVTATDLARAPRILEDRDIVWVYLNDTLDHDGFLNEKLFRTLKRYLKEGGKVILANQAATFLTDLDLEENAPLTRIKTSRDEGYGRQLGFHAFRDHPIFSGLNGGAYVLKPEKDTMVFHTGYFGGSIPENGRVAAVDWDYIFLREDSKLILEYEPGEGKPGQG